jgi:hypothetical protein
MTVQQHAKGEEYTVKIEAGILSRASQITFGLFNDSTDNLSANSDIADITTEPTTGNYTRQTFSLDGTNFSVQKNNNGNFEYVKDGFQWDLSSTTETVDSWFAIIEFNADGDTSKTPHLVYSGSLDQVKDLSTVDDVNVTNIGRIQKGV